MAWNWEGHCANWPTGCCRSRQDCVCPCSKCVTARAASILPPREGYDLATNVHVENCQCESSWIDPNCAYERGRRATLLRVARELRERADFVHAVRASGADELRQAADRLEREANGGAG